MSTELYGVNGELVQSIATTPVSTDTTIIFIGACASGDLNKPYIITSFSDYASRLGGARGDGYNLTEAAIAAFDIAKISKVVMIPISHETDFTASDYIGDGISTGASAIVRYLASEPKTVVLVCAPGVTDATALAALKSACKKADGHWDSVLVYDIDVPSAAVSGGVFVDADAITKSIADEQAIACLGKVQTDGGNVVSMAPVRACLMARSDADFGVPARSGGNLNIPGVVSFGGFFPEETTLASVVTNLGPGNGYVYLGSNATTPYMLGANAGQLPEDAHYRLVEYPNVTIQKMSSVGDKYLAVKSADIASGTSVTLAYYEEGAEIEFRSIDLPEARSTELSANGICAIVNYSGSYYTWGDHTSLFTNGTVADERARFDNSIRMLLMLTNRFQIKYRTSIDSPMTLQMRNDVINEELDFMASLVAIGALIGEPVCEFAAIDNSLDSLAQGQFTWRTESTPTIPFKHGNIKVAYSQAGLLVYIA